MIGFGVGVSPHPCIMDGNQGDITGIFPAAQNHPTPAGGTCHLCTPCMARGVLHYGQGDDMHYIERKYVHPQVCLSSWCVCAESGGPMGVNLNLYLSNNQMQNAVVAYHMHCSTSFPILNKLRKCWPKSALRLFHSCFFFTPRYPHLSDHLSAIDDHGQDDPVHSTDIWPPQDCCHQCWAIHHHAFCTLANGWPTPDICYMVPAPPAHH